MFNSATARGRCLQEQANRKSRFQNCRANHLSAPFASRRNISRLSVSSAGVITMIEAILLKGAEFRHHGTYRPPRGQWGRLTLSGYPCMLKRLRSLLSIGLIETSAMFRTVANRLLILSILLCPHYCGEGCDAVAAVSQNGSLDDCCDCCRDHSTDECPNEPSPCHDGCSHDCICKGAVNERGDFLLGHIDFGYPVCSEACTAEPTSPALLVAGIRPYCPTHSDLGSGVAIRLAFASLLI